MYYHHISGCGGLVVNDQDEILVMQEKTPAYVLSSTNEIIPSKSTEEDSKEQDQKHLHLWKLPGGQANIGKYYVDIVLSQLVTGFQGIDLNLFARWTSEK